MKKIVPIIATISIVSLLSVPVVLAQPSIGRGNSRGSPYHRMYDPKTVETITGQVIGIENSPSPRGMSGGIHLKVKSQNEVVSVHLGPAWYINNQTIPIKLQDQIEVKGSRINFAGQPAIIAAEVKKDNQILKLRDENGVPVWAGWRRQQR
ncbi:hypothetical protein [Halotia branconii]|uniref:Magnetosome protein MamS/MamX domain-containing protein n=1 Tax=Halotia branconii CENA392 TaxID=1539056 RepID=A0AAJ6NRY9_9CYAN|nr:hypothetical protein [Halotia branconii]WGV25639.1 hypothetical protein QI031_28615 [Halotia branconii CENA392]